jgi:FkbM family methyltransferase
VNANGVGAAADDSLAGPTTAARMRGFIALLHARAFWSRQRLLRGDRTLDRLSPLVRRDEVVVDVGAHRGLYTLWFATRVGGRGEVHAFEPNPLFHARLSAIGAHLPQVKFHPTALSSRHTTRALFVPHLAGKPVPSLGRLSLEGQFATVNHDSVAVSAERLDDISFSKPPSLLKIDVEGHELEVLRGAERLLRQTPPSILVEVEQRHRDGDLREVFGYLETLGYDGWFVRAGAPQALATFDLERDQQQFTSTVLSESIPGEYIYDFLFFPNFESG